MPNLNTSTRNKIDTEPDAQVTIAFKRTFIEGPFDGLSFYAMTRKVTLNEAARLVVDEPSVGFDGDGNRAIDSYTRICADDADPLALEHYELLQDRVKLQAKLRAYEASNSV
jgi:hypothetical protein